MFDENDITFAMRLKKLREYNNLTQTDLSEIVGYKNYSTVSKWESGASLPRGKELKILSEYFGVSTDYLLGMDKLKESKIITIYNKLSYISKQRLYDFAARLLTEQFLSSETEPTEDVLKIVYRNTDKKIKPIPRNANLYFTVEEDALEPFLKKGEIVFIQETDVVGDGEVAIAEDQHSNLFLGKIKCDYDNQKMIFKPLNKNYDSKTYDANQINIFGKVLK